MPISRMQQPRQMYGLGSFVKKAVKGVTGAVKNIAKSDVGKAALAIAAVKFGGPLAAKAFPGTFGSAATSPFMRALGRGQFLGDTGIFSAGKTALFGSNAVGPNVKEGLFQRALSKIPGGGGVTAGITAASIAGGMLTPEAQEDVQALRQSGDQGLLKAYLERYYRNLNPDADDETVASFVRANAANGGRMGYAFGTDEEEFLKKVKEEDEKMEQDEDYLRKIIDPEDMALSKKRMMKMAEYKESETSKRVKELMDEGYTFGEAVKQAMKEGLKEGGRPGYAMGTPEKNAIQASGIMDLPLNQNPAGVTELDLRETGGFIPPVGVKEKADDIPAMLSNNEFVFTADAVRGMGDGNVNKGAQRMYDFMKYLENGGRV